MKTYMNRVDREHHLAMLIVWDYLSSWLQKTKCLTKDERKRVKTATTHLLRTSDSIVSRLEMDYAKRILRDAKNKEIRIVSRPAGGSNGDTENVRVDDLYDLADYTLVGCRECKRENRKECEKYKLLMSLNVPVAQIQTAGCPYEN